MTPLLLALCLVGSPAEHIQAGEAALAALEYEQAAFELMLAATDPAATPEQKLRANLLCGIAHRVIGKDTDARLNFRYVLLQAPDTRLPPDTPPKVGFFFESVRQEIEAERAAAAPASSPAPAAPAPAPETPAPGALLVTGAVLAAVGGVALVAGGGLTLIAESSLADPDRPASERASLRGFGQASLAAAVIGAATGVAGGALLGVEAAQ